MLKKFIPFFLMVVLLNACQTHFPVVSDGMDSEKSDCDKTIETVELTDIDYLLYANKMIDSMAKSKSVQKEIATKRMYLTVLPVLNNTTEAIEISLVNTAIKNRLLRSGYFILNDDSNNQYQLSGSFDDMAQSANACSKKYKRFLLQLKNKQNNHLLWSEEKRFD